MGRNWVVVALIALTTASAEAGTTTRVSVGPGGIQGNEISGFSNIDISADGRFVAFSSYASNLVADDHNDEEDVFLRDLARNETYLISTATGRSQGNHISYSPAISADGRFVCFQLFASNLVPGDTNGELDVFLRDRAKLTTMRIDTRPDGRQAKKGASDCDISNDGRFVAFESDSSDLVAGDTNKDSDIFVYDRVKGRIERVSISDTGKQALGGYSISASISANGRFVAFQSTARNLVAGPKGDGANIYIRDRQEKRTVLVSRGLGGAPINVGSSAPVVSADGRYVAFDSNSSNLVAGDTNDTDDVFVYDTQSGKTSRISISTSGQQGNESSLYPRISANGRLVVFHSYATNLISGDTNGSFDIFVHDRKTGTTTRASVSSSGGQANGDSSYHFAIAPQGDKVAFISDATNLVPGDTNGVTDVFLRQLK